MNLTNEEYEELMDWVTSRREAVEQFLTNKVRWKTSLNPVDRLVYEQKEGDLALIKGIECKVRESHGSH